MVFIRQKLGILDLGRKTIKIAKTIADDIITRSRSGASARSRSRRTSQVGNISLPHARHWGIAVYLGSISPPTQSSSTSSLPLVNFLSLCLVEYLSQSQYRCRSIERIDTRTSTIVSQYPRYLWLFHGQFVADGATMAKEIFAIAWI